MAAHRRQPLAAPADPVAPAFAQPLWGTSQPGRRWSLRVRLMARLTAPWLDLALAAGADPAGSPTLERRAALILSHLHRVRIVASLRQGRRGAGRRLDPGDLRVPVDAEEVRLAEAELIELEDLLISPTPVYARGVVMAADIVGDGTGPLYEPRRRGELRERVGKVLAALRGAL
jgi:hypothetical protein